MDKEEILQIIKDASLSRTSIHDYMNSKDFIKESEKLRELHTVKMENKKVGVNISSIVEEPVGITVTLTEEEVEVILKALDIHKSAVSLYDCYEADLHNQKICRSIEDKLEKAE